MCKASVEPSPSTMFSPNRLRQASNTSPANTSAADRHNRTLDTSACAADGSLISAV